MKRSSLAPGAPLKRSGMVRRRSPRRTAYSEELALMRPVVVARAGGVCHVCYDPGTVVHHRKLRSQGGTNEVDNLMLLCQSCHEYVHNHPALAVAAGYILRRGDHVDNFAR